MEAEVVKRLQMVILVGLLTGNALWAAVMEFEYKQAPVRDISEADSRKYLAFYQIYSALKANGCTHIDIETKIDKYPFAGVTSKHEDLGCSFKVRAECSQINDITVENAPRSERFHTKIILSLPGQKVVTICPETYQKGK